MRTVKYKVTRRTGTNKSKTTNHKTLTTAMKEAKKSINSFKEAKIVKLKPIEACKVATKRRKKRRTKRKGQM